MKVFSNALLVCLVFFSNISIGQEEESFSLNMLESAINSGHINESVKQINLSKHEQYRKDVSSYIVNLWSQRFSTDKKVLKNDLVIINIADFLSQARSNNFIEIDEGLLLKLARSSINSKNRHVTSQALNILARSSRKEDVAVILSLIENTHSEYLFNVSVMSVLAQCSDSMNNELNQLKNLSNKQKKYIKESLGEFNSAGLCQSVK